MLVSKMYWLVSFKYLLKITNVEIWVNQYLTDVTNTNWYLTDTLPISPILYKTDFQYQLKISQYALNFKDIG